MKEVLTSYAALLFERKWQLSKMFYVSESACIAQGQKIGHVCAVQYIFYSLKNLGTITLIEFRGRNLNLFDTGRLVGYVD